MSCHGFLTNQKGDRDGMLAMLRLEKTLLESKKPLLTSQCEATLLRTSILLRIDSIISSNFIHSDELGCTISKTIKGQEIPSKQKFFKEVWWLVCGILSSALYKRPSYLVKSRVPLAVAVFRNLLLGLTCVADQNLYNHTNSHVANLRPSVERVHLSLEELESMSHNLDRCLDLIRGTKLKDDFARIAPYIIADILEAGFAGRVTVVPIVKTNLLSGMNKVQYILY